MAIWQFSVSLVPIEGLLNHYGKLIEVVPEYGEMDPENPPDLDNPVDYPNYWQNAQYLTDIAKRVSEILPQIESWSSEALMFGEERGNKVEIWNNDVYCRIDARSPDPNLLRLIADLAAEFKCVVVLKEGGRVVPGDVESLNIAFLESKAVNFCLDPAGFIKAGKHALHSEK